MNTIGKKVWILTDEGEYNGTIHAVDSKNKRLILQRVSLADGRKIRGLQTFFAKDIRSLQLLEEVGSDGEGSERSSEHGQDANINEETLEHADIEQRKIFTEKDPSDEGSRLIPTKPFLPNKYLSGEDNLYMNAEKDEFRDIPDLILVDELNEEFYKAIGNINEQRVVGLSAEANSMGRSGTLCLLTVGCRCATYIFDVHKLGAECFARGLHSFLEDRYILKVIHDCRLLSDCLFHVHGVEMRNVFDSQVADIIIYKQTRGKLPRDVNGLEPCLFEYLNIKPSRCTFSSVISRFAKNDANLWTTRPLERELLDAVAEKVVCLRELKIAQFEKMNAEFLFGVDIYLEVFRNSPVDCTNALGKARKVPAGFNDLKKVTERRWRRYEDRDKQITKRDAYFSEIQTGKEVAYKDDGGWTEGSKFADIYRQKHGKIIERDDLGQETWSSLLTDESEAKPASIPWNSIKQNNADTSMKDNLVLRSEGSSRHKQNEKSKNSVNLKTDLRNTVDTRGSQVTSEGPNLANGKTEAVARDEWFESEIAQEGSMDLESLKQDTPKSRRFERTPPASRTPPREAIRDSYLPDVQRIQLVEAYNSEYPPLSPENQNASKSVDSRKDSPGYEMKAKMNLAEVLGVRSESPRPVAVGRAKQRSHFASFIPPLGTPPGPGDASRARHRTDFLSDTHSFPSDEDILHTDPIIKVGHDRPVAGQKMRVQKIKLKD